MSQSETLHAHAQARAARMVGWHRRGFHSAAGRVLGDGDDPVLVAQVCRLLVGRLAAVPLGVFHPTCDVEWQALSLVKLTKDGDDAAVEWWITHPVRPLVGVCDVLARLAAEEEA